MRIYQLINLEGYHQQVHPYTALGIFKRDTSNRGLQLAYFEAIDSWSDNKKFTV